jgi:predicted ATP-grasp superfamily ATP-dependent carboligase
MARAGWTVGVAGGSPTSVAASSRWCAWWDPVPPPEAGVDQFVSAINAAAVQRGYEVALPCGDAEALALSRERDHIRPLVPYPPHEVVARAFDKLQLAEAAASAGVPTPATTLVRIGAPLPPVAPPVIIKERLHAGLNEGSSVRMEAAVAASAAEASDRVAAIHAAGSDAVIQDAVAGRLIAHASVTAPDGRVVVALQQEAERIFPQEAGASARARTVPLDPDLAEGAARLLRELRWCGLAELQFLAADGARPSLIDFNGRFYGSLALAVGAGANLPAVWAAVATGRPLGAVPAVVPGTRYQWLEGDLRVATGARGGALVREVLGCIRYGVGARHAIWSVADPLPQVRDGLRLLRQEAPNLHRLGRKLLD